jgi:hypothetical protein
MSNANLSKCCTWVAAALERRPGLTAVLLGLLAAGWSWFRMWGGPTIPSGDSVAYLESARSLLETQRYGWLVWELGGNEQLRPGSFEVNTIWPPALPALLAGTLWLGVEPQLAVRCLVALFAGLAVATSYGVAALILRPGPLAMGVTLLYAGMFEFQWWVVESWMAEGIYLAAVGGGIVLFHRMARESTPAPAFLALGLLFSVAYYLKSIGPAFILAAGVSMLALRQWSLGRRIVCATWLAAGCAVGALPWLLRNLSYGTIGSGGQAIAHPILQSSLDLVRLFVPRHGPYLQSPRTVVLLGLFAFGGLVLAGALILPRGRRGRAVEWLSRIEAAGPGAVFALVYLLVFVAAASAGVALEKTGWIETRYWMEIGLFLLAFAALAVRTGAALLEGLPARVVRPAAWVVVACLFVANLWEFAHTWPQTRLRLPTAMQQSDVRRDIVRLLPPAERFAFVSNERYRFGVESGLTASFSEAEAVRRAGGRERLQLVYAAYPLDRQMDMALVKTPPTVPAGWVEVGRLGAMSLHVPPQSSGLQGGSGPSPAQP